MYRGYPDFQHTFTCDNTQWFAAYQSEGCYYRYPKLYAKLAENPLAFALNITRSNTSKTIYGALDFRCVLDYIPTSQLTEFYSQHPNTEVLALPVTPYKLSFAGPTAHPSELTQKHYSASWFAAQSIQFTLLLNSETTELIEKTLVDNIVGFSARMDGLIEGVSPRLNYQITCDPKILLGTLSKDIEETKIGKQSYIFPYDALLDYFAKHLTTLCIDISPKPASQDPSLIQLIAQTTLDRLYNHFGAPICGSATNNLNYVRITPPAGNGRLILDLSEVVLTRRPIAILLDPFTAAQQIAQVSPQQVIHRTTAPAIPENKITIDVIYPLPPGLVDGVNINIQVELPSGVLYPVPQRQTKTFKPGSTQIAFNFNNNSISTPASFSYQLQVSYPTQSGYQHILGEKRQHLGHVLVLDSSSYPCHFFSLEIDQAFAQSSRIEGRFSTGTQNTPFELNSKQPYFNYPVLDGRSEAFITANDLNSKATLTRDRPIIASTQVGAYSFPEFGHHQATVNVKFANGSAHETVKFQSQSTGEVTQHTFTPSQPLFDYQWNAVSIYKPGFRYQYGDSPWSEYVTNHQTIHLETIQ